MSSASIQKLFCGIYSTFKCSFDEFVGEQVFSPSYSSAILAPPPKILFLKQYVYLFKCLLNLLKKHTHICETVMYPLFCIHAQLLSCEGPFVTRMAGSPPGSSVHGISQAKILECIALSSSMRSSWPRDWTHASCRVSSVQFSRSVVSDSLWPHES